MVRVGMHGRGGMGVCARQQGMHGRGGVCGREYAWQGGMCGRETCMVGGMCRGACLARGDMCGRGHVWQGACMAGGCMAGGMHGRYYEMQSMSGQYASYWNAFLLTVKLQRPHAQNDHFSCFWLFFFQLYTRSIWRSMFHWKYN